METVEEFKKNFNNTYYNNVIKLLTPFEKKRKTEFAKCILFALLSFIVFCIGIYLFINQETLFAALSKKTVEDIMFIPLGIGFFLACVPSVIAKSFENTVKEKVMPIILRNLDGFFWAEGSCINNDYIEKSRLVTDFNERDNDDNFHGIYKNVEIDICETELGLETGSGKNRHYTVKFKGVLVRLLPERQYKGITLIKKQGIINSVPDKLQRVYLEDAEFEKQFNVYSNDQIEARFLLTTAFMERFKNIKLAFNASKIEASISEQGILIGISLNKDLFKLAKVYRPIYDYELFKQMAEEFASILELIDELKMYQNIGL